MTTFWQRHCDCLQMAGLNPPWQARRALTAAPTDAAVARRAFDALMKTEKIDIAAIEVARAADHGPLRTTSPSSNTTLASACSNIVLASLVTS